MADGEQPQLYDPPYDSPIQDRFAERASRFFDPQQVTLRSEVPVRTICGDFRLDFLVEVRGRAIAIECDGRGFHDYRRDFCRDSLILCSGAVEALYRIPGSSIWYHLDEVLYCLLQWEPDLFSTRAATNLPRIAHEDLTHVSGWFDRHATGISFSDAPESHYYVEYDESLDDFRDEPELEIGDEVIGMKLIRRSLDETGWGRALRQFYNLVDAAEETHFNAAMDRFYRSCVR
jgi:hypothetical protein